MANPQWPSFPGVPNMTVDGQGRPQVQDLIPGKQLGTPLDAALINPLIASVCGLWDEQENTIGPEIAKCLQAISAETSRAEAAEGQAVSGTDGLTRGDIPGRGLHTEGDNNTVLYNDGVNGWRALALQSDHAAEVSRAQAAEADIRTAFQAGLQAERDRATGAESQAISGTYGVTPGDTPGRALHTGADTNIIWYYDARNGWRALALRSELLDEIRRAQAAEADIRTAFQAALQAERDRATGAESQAVSGTDGLTRGDIPGRGLHTEGDNNIVLYNDGVNGWRALALRSELLDEISRAQAAEADLRTALQAGLNTKLSRAGDTSSGSLIFNSGNSYQPWAVTPQNIFSIGGGGMSLWGQVDGDNNMQLVLGGNNPGQPYLPPWIFNPTRKTVTTPSGNTLLETNSSATKVQTFTAYVRFDQTNPARILFPVAFAPGTIPTVILTPTTEVIGSYVAWCSYGIDKKDSTSLDVDNTGFTCTSYALGPNGRSSGENLVPITAIGVMS